MTKRIAGKPFTSLTRFSPPKARSFGSCLSLPDSNGLTSPCSVTCGKSRFRGTRVITPRNVQTGYRLVHRTQNDTICTIARFLDADEANMTSSNQGINEEKMGKTVESVFDFEVDTLDGQPIRLGEFAGKVLLIVNTASQCGFTPQYAGLEKLYRTYNDRGLVVLGFPCNQFGAQEPGSASDISSFCDQNYG